jgi:sodium transport system permease protein
MNFKRALIVYKKEMLEMFRDKRTIFSTIILPFILYPLLFIGAVSLMSRQTLKLEEQGAVIALVDSVQTDATKVITDQLKLIEHFSYVPFTAETAQQYKEKYVHAIVSLTDSVQIGGIPVYKVVITLDKSTDRGKMMYDKFFKVLKTSEAELLKKRLAERGISAEIVSTLNIYQNDTSTSQKKLGSLLGAILPYLLIMLLVAGASVVAGDLVAGEKERKTLETLIVSSAHRNEIVMGKYLTVITFALINVAVNLVSLYFSMRNIASQSGLEMAGVKFPLDGFLILFIALIPLATLYAAVLLSISTFSRNMKEARSYEQPIILVSMLLAMSSFFPAIELTNGLALIPIINISLLFKAVMMSDYKLTHLFLTIGSTLVLDIIAIIVTIKLFNNESVLFRSDVDSSLKNVKKNKGVFFTPYYGLIYYVAALLALYYIGSKLQLKSISTGLIQTQIFMILLPVFVVLRIIKADYKQVLRLNPTKAVNFLIVPFIAVSGAIIVTMIGQLINMIYPFPSEYLKQLESIMKMPDLKLWQVYAIIAILPGICEELMFRGFIFRFFENQGKWMAILISAILFAVFHLDPYRFIPVLLLGILLAWIMVKADSIYVSMFSHALNNALALTFVQFDKLPLIRKMLVSNDNLNWWLAIPAVIVLTVSLYAFNHVNRKSVERL